MFDHRLRPSILAERVIVLFHSFCVQASVFREGVHPNLIAHRQMIGMPKAYHFF